MEYKDYYQVLGVGRDADEKEIKRTYRRLARELHPDVNQDDPRAEERFKEINEAYQVLSDPEKKHKYDRLGSAWQGWERTGGRPGDFDWGQWTSAAPGGQRVNVRYGTAEDLEGLFGGGSGFSDFFSQIFGGIGGAQGGFQYQARPRRGQDLEQPIEITLEEAFRGTSRLLQKNGRKLQVKVPSGAASGTRIRVAGEGAPGQAGGEPGDLYLRVKVATDGRFERRGDDLSTTVEVDLYTAVLGGSSQVFTLNGLVTLTIPAGTQAGQTFRLKGKGMPSLRQSDKYGDLYAQVKVHLPEQLTPRQKELFEQLHMLSQEQ
jgi:curved DNA-binding protein